MGATDEVEVSLAEQGFFRDVNWLDRASTKLYIIGENLLEHFVPEDAEKQVKRVDGPSNASVTKDDVASYVVVHPRVFVREQPSVDAKYVGHLPCPHQSSSQRVMLKAAGQVIFLRHCVPRRSLRRHGSARPRRRWLATVGCSGLAGFRIARDGEVATRCDFFEELPRPVPNYARECASVTVEGQRGHGPY